MRSRVKQAGFFLVAAFALFSRAAPGSEGELRCGVSVELRIKAVKAPAPSRKTVCLRSDRSWALVEEGCGRNFGKCLANVLDGGPKEETWPATVGNPSFHLCAALKGKPEFVSWRRDRKDSWVHTSVCFLRDTFLDLDHLMEAWKKGR